MDGVAVFIDPAFFQPTALPQMAHEIRAGVAASAAFLANSKGTCSKVGLRFFHTPYPVTLCRKKGSRFQKIRGISLRKALYGRLREEWRRARWRIDSTTVILCLL